MDTTGKVGPKAGGPLDKDALDAILKFAATDLYRDSLAMVQGEEDRFVRAVGG